MKLDKSYQMYSGLQLQFVLKKERAKRFLIFCLTLHKLSNVKVNSPLNKHTISEVILKKNYDFKETYQ